MPAYTHTRTHAYTSPTKRQLYNLGQLELEPDSAPPPAYHWREKVCIKDDEIFHKYVPIWIESEQENE